MKKLLKIATVLTLAGLLFVAGIFAAKTVNFSTSNSDVTFTSNSAYVKIECNIYSIGSAGKELVSAKSGKTFYTYDTSNNTPKSNNVSWDMGTLAFTDNATEGTYINEYEIVMKFTNEGQKNVTVSFGNATFVAYAVDGTSITGGTTAGAPQADELRKATINGGGTNNETFTYNIKLTSMRAAFTTAKLQLSATITAAA